MSTHERNILKGLHRKLNAESYNPEQLLWEYVELAANRQYQSDRTIGLIRVAATLLEKRTRKTEPSAFWWVNETAYTLAKSLARNAERGNPGYAESLQLDDDMALSDKLIARCNAAQQWNVDACRAEMAGRKD